MITRREAERLCKSFLGDNSPPRLPDNFAFEILHDCAWGCRGQFVPARYNSSRAKCIKCSYCAIFFSPNKVSLVSFTNKHELCHDPSSCSTLTACRRGVNMYSLTRLILTRGGGNNSVSGSIIPHPVLCRHVRLLGDPPDEVVHSWEDVKAMFNGGTRKRMMSSSPSCRGQESPPPSTSHPGYPSPPPPCKQVKTEVIDTYL